MWPLYPGFFIKYSSDNIVVKFTLYVAAGFLLVRSLLGAYAAITKLREAFWFGREAEFVGVHCATLFWSVIMSLAIVFATRWAINYIDGVGREI